MIFIFPFIDTRYFFLGLKLQYCRTIVFLNKLELLKKPLFQKRRWLCNFPPRKTLAAQRHWAISRQEKKGFSLNSPPPPPPPESEPKFLASIGYQIFLRAPLRTLLVFYLWSILSMSQLQKHERRTKRPVKNLDEKKTTGKTWNEVKKIGRRLTFQSRGSNISPSS